MVRGRSKAVALTSVALAVFSLSACKSGGGGGSAGGSSSGAAAGKPIRLMVDAPITGGPATGGVAFPGPANGTKAAAAALNKKGGINGHPVVIDVCDNKTDPNGGAACGRTAKQNGDLAVVGSFDIVGAPGLLKILQSEGIPYVGGLPGSPQELSNTISFQFDGGVNLGGIGTIAQMKDQGCTHAVDFSPGGPAASLDPILTMEYAKAGLKFDIIVATSGTADMNPFVSRALALNPDCVSAEGPGQDTAKIIGALRKSGSNVKIFTSIGSLVPQVLAAIGGLADGVYADNTTLLPTDSDPYVTQFRNDIFASMGQTAGTQNLNEFAQDGWSSVMVVDQALKGVTEISSKSLLDALNKLSDAMPGNVRNPVDFTKIRDSKLFPRMFNTYVRYFIIKNGQYTDLDNQWHDAGQFVP